MFANATSKGDSVNALSEELNFGLGESIIN